MKLFSLLILLISFKTYSQEKISVEFIKKMCEKHNASNCTIIQAMSWVENRYRNVTVTDNGSLSYGPLQIKCDTARMVGLKFDCEQLRDPEVSIRFAIKYYELQLKRYNGNIEKAVAAYNAGSATICKNINRGDKGIQCFPGEYYNQSYVLKVWRKYKFLKREESEYKKDTLLNWEDRSPIYVTWENYDLSSNL